MSPYHGITRCGGKEACGHEDDGDDVVEAVANMLVIETDPQRKEETCKYRHGGRLAGTIVTQQRRDFA